MHLGSSTQSEIALTIDVAVEMANALTDDELDLRSSLNEAGFSRASSASEASMTRLEVRLAELVPLLEALVDATTEVETAAATKRVNEQLTELRVAPAVVSHDGSAPHIHWTPASATFDDQVMTDILMALAQELVDHAAQRFGRCGAVDCAHLFFDQTKNHSRRFCSDGRCASRTHTADHRARRKSRR